ncbi:5' nucleotidase, NT5C type [Pasteuria penetrans]|uniref:5' nucleotidase, NT5C type n=1 Tax=Pasteuria penetrans TaxID=86005 RepID=UPI000FA6CE17|nr:hypothetical protein [Pasteuria penetrans]
MNVPSAGLERFFYTVADRNIWIGGGFWMRIGVDLDGTVKNTFATAVTMFNQWFKRELSLNDFNFDSLRLDLAYGVGIEEITRLWHQWENNIYKNSHPFEHAVSTLQNFQKEHEIYFITARPDTLPVREVTEAWLRKYLFPFTGKNLYMNSIEKGKLSEDLGIEIFFEDDPIHLQNLVHYKIPTVIMDAPYNRSFSHPLRRMHCWSEADQFICVVPYNEVDSLSTGSE